MQHEYSSRGFFEYEGESSELKVFRLCNLHLVCASKLKLGAVLVRVVVLPTKKPRVSTSILGGGSPLARSPKELGGEGSDLPYRSSDA